MVTKKAQLDWLDNQRAAINEKIVGARQEDKGQYMPELQIINAIAEHMGEMTAVEYLKAMREIRVVCLERIRGCDGCHFYNACPFLWTTSDADCVAIVKRWKEEHSDV